MQARPYHFLPEPRPVIDRMLAAARSQEAVAACDHAIASDATLADAYYIKGSILFGQGQLEHGKYAVPPGTTEALNKYLEYAPDGDHARTVHDMIDQLGKDMGTVYRAPKKK